MDGPDYRQQRADMTGECYGRLTVLSQAGRLHGRPAWLTQCQCGNQKVATRDDLRRGAVTSCGCFRTEKRRALAAALNKSHGLYGTEMHRIWRSMLARCQSKTHIGYRYYGGRGVKVCERWMDLNNFIADMGQRPTGASLDRIDPDGDYEPGNCRWATVAEQNRNKRTNVNLTLAGRTQCAAEWARELGVTQGAIAWRKKQGWSDEQTLTKPFRRGRNG